MQKYANLANWLTEIQPSMQVQSKGSCEINEIRKSEENSEVGLNMWCNSSYLHLSCVLSSVEKSRLLKYAPKVYIRMQL